MEHKKGLKNKFGLVFFLLFFIYLAVPLNFSMNPWRLPIGDPASAAEPGNSLKTKDTSGSFPFICDLTVAPGDTFVDLRWTPVWKEEAVKAGRAREVEDILRSNLEGRMREEEKTRVPAGIERARRSTPEEIRRVMEQIPEEKEIAGYIIHSGTSSRNYTNRVDVGLVTRYRVRGLSNYSNYFFAIQAYTRTRELSELSREISTTPKEEKDLLSSIERSFAEEKVAPQVSREIKQFGYDFFLSKASSFAPVTDVPVEPDYLIGPGDAFTVNLWGRIEASFPVEVNRQGEITLPKIGSLKVWGMTFAQMQGFLQEQIGKYYKDFQMNISMDRLRTIRVFIVGEAQAPGNYVLSSLATVYHALIASGGPSKRGSLRNIELRRNGKAIETIDLYDFFLKGDRSNDARLKSGDTIFIPVIGPAVGISGSAKRPGIYELKKPLSLKEFIDLAGGVTFQGYLQRVQVERVETHQKKIVVDFDLSIEEKASSSSMASILQDGDFVKIFPIYLRPEKIVFLEGHVKKPGSFEFRPGMKVSDLIPSFDALLPESYLEHGEIQRLVPPDLKPRTLSFNLGRLLQGDAQHNLELQDQDRVIVFAQSAMKEIPHVRVSGEIQSPGRYRLAEKMKIRDLIFQAGNIKRSAFLEEAELTRLVKTQQEVVSKVFKINLGEVLKENPEYNIYLEEDDTLFIRQIPKWYIDKKIALTGEVKFPGTYTFHKGERLSSVLERAGGFTREAYLPGAFFTRESVRKVQEKRLRDFIEEQEQEIIKEGAKLVEGALSKEDAEQRQKALAQRRELIARLKAATVTGRVVIKLTSLDKFKGSEYDLELEDEDSISIPNTPSSVLVMGRVYNPNAIIFVKERSVRYYLDKVGGPAENADEKRIHLVKADGSVISRTQESLWGFRWDTDTKRWVSGGFLSTSIDPGDTILVPEKYERIYWTRELRDWTQIFFQIAVAAGVIVALY